MMHKLALFAGSAAAAIFVISQLPLLSKACRTKDLGSYSLANIVLASLGNLLYATYLVQLPFGPVWAIHGFNLTTSALMLLWYLRYRRRAESLSAAQPHLTTQSDHHLLRSGINARRARHGEPEVVRHVGSTVTSRPARSARSAVARPEG